jgi:hypothetical protein
MGCFARSKPHRAETRSRSGNVCTFYIARLFKSNIKLTKYNLGFDVWTKVVLNQQVTICLHDATGQRNPVPRSGAEKYGRTRWTGDQHVARALPAPVNTHTHTHTHTHKELRHISTSSRIWIRDLSIQATKENKHHYDRQQMTLPAIISQGRRFTQRR